MSETKEAYEESLRNLETVASYSPIASWDPRQDGEVVRTHVTALESERDKLQDYILKQMAISNDLREAVLEAERRGLIWAAEEMHPHPLSEAEKESLWNEYQQAKREEAKKA
jgi:hypothetical protein